MSCCKKKSSERERQHEVTLRQMERERIIRERQRKVRLREQRKIEAERLERERWTEAALEDCRYISRSKASTLQAARDKLIKELAASFNRCFYHSWAKMKDIKDSLIEVENKAIKMFKVTEKLRNQLDALYVVKSGNDKSTKKVRFSDGNRSHESTDYIVRSSQIENTECPSCSKLTNTRQETRPSQSTQTGENCLDNTSELAHCKTITPSGSFTGRIVNVNDSFTTMEDPFESSSGRSSPEYIGTERRSRSLRRPSVKRANHKEYSMSPHIYFNSSLNENREERRFALQSPPYQYRVTSIDATLGRPYAPMVLPVIHPPRSIRDQDSSEDSSLTRYDANFENFRRSKNNKDLKTKKTFKRVSKNKEFNDVQSSGDDTDSILDLCKQSTLKNRSREPMTLPRKSESNVLSSSAEKESSVQRTREQNDPGSSKTSQNFEEDVPSFGDVAIITSIENTLNYVDSTVEQIKEFEAASIRGRKYLNQSVEQEHNLDKRLKARKDTSDMTMYTENFHNFPPDGVRRDNVSADTQCDEVLGVINTKIYPSNTPPSGKEASPLDGNTHIIDSNPIKISENEYSNDESSPSLVLEEIRISSKDTEQRKISNIIQNEKKLSESVDTEENSQSEETKPSMTPSSRPRPPNTLDLKVESKSLPPQCSINEGPSQDSRELNNYYKSNIEIVDMSPRDKIPYVDHNEEFSVSNKYSGDSDNKIYNRLSQKSTSAKLDANHSFDQERVEFENKKNILSENPSVPRSSNDERLIITDLNPTSDSTTTSLDSSIKNIKLIDDSSTFNTNLDVQYNTYSNDLEENVEPEIGVNIEDQSNSNPISSTKDDSPEKVEDFTEKNNDSMIANSTSCIQLHPEHSAHISNEKQENAHQAPDVDGKSQEYNYLIGNTNISTKENSEEVDEFTEKNDCVLANSISEVQLVPDPTVQISNENQESSHEAPDVDGNSQDYYYPSGNVNDQDQQEPNNDTTQHIDFNQYQEDITQTGYTFDQTNSQQYPSEYPEHYFYPNTNEQAFDTGIKNNVSYPQEPNEYISNGNDLFAYQTAQYGIDPNYMHSTHLQPYYPNWEHQNMQYSEGYEPPQVDQRKVDGINQKYNNDQDNSNYDVNNQIFEYGTAESEVKTIESVVSSSSTEEPNLQPDVPNTVEMTQPRFNNPTDKQDDVEHTSNSKELGKSNNVTAGETEMNASMSETGGQKDVLENLTNEVDSSETILSDRKESENEITMKPLDEPSTSSILNPNHVPGDSSPSSRQSPTGGSKIQNIFGSMESNYDQPMRTVNSNEEKPSETTKVAKIGGKPGNDNQKALNPKKGLSEPNTRDNTKLKATVKKDHDEKKGGSQTLKKSSSRYK